MGEVFGSLYADIYDSIYRDKNYDEECGILCKLFDLYGDGCISSVLDLGCGTDEIHPSPYKSNNLRRIPHSSS